MPNATPAINDILQAQLATLQALKAALAAEEEAILERDVAALNQATADKSEQLLNLRELETLRRNASAAIDGPELAKLRRALDDVRTQNRANASLIQTQREHLARLLRLLRGGTEARHYDQDGRQRELGRRNPLATA
jgi:flagellar biosynthesis/type III secretory pathway chaperone